MVRHTLNLESGLNDGLALPFVLFFLVLARRRRRRPGGRRAARRGGRRRRNRDRARRDRRPASLRLPGGGITARYEGIYAVGFGLAAFGLADVTFGNGLIAAFVAGIVLAREEHEVPDSFVAFSENVSSIFAVITFFLFGALIVATGYDGSIWALLAFIPFALLVARPVAVLAALVGTKLPRPQRLFIAWFGPAGWLDAVRVVHPRPECAEGSLVFDVAAFVILSSILAHGLTDTVGVDRAADGAAGEGGLGRDGREPLLDPLGRGDVLAHPELLRRVAQREADELGRWSTARPSSRPVIFAASGCCMSRFRWHSGHGVTRQSAPASSASSIWVPAWRSEVSRFIVMIGNPQHLRAPEYSTTSPPSVSITRSR